MRGIHTKSSPLLPHIHPSSLIMEWSVKSACLVVTVFPVVAFDVRIDPGSDGMTHWSSAENAADSTESTCPVNGPGAVPPLETFHTRIVRSSEPETMRWPSGENATDPTKPVCPVNGPATASPVVAFHIRIVRSCEPETMRWPSGENATE